jgi:hypothetical protein
LLKPILSPAELEEYRLRESPQAELLRSFSVDADVTQNEFKALMAMNDKLKDYRFSYLPELRKEQIDTLTESVGSSRARELVAKCDGIYPWARMAAEQYGLPISAADQAVKIKWDTQDAEARIQTDASLSPDLRQRQFAELNVSAETALVKCLGTNGATVAKHGWQPLVTFLPRR